MSTQGLKIISEVLFAAAAVSFAAAVFSIFLPLFKKRPQETIPEAAEKNGEVQLTLEESIEYMESRDIIEQDERLI
ncbi:MAG: hypothetical protein IKR59_02580 [Lachnospiraceae bacterium]|nr:hypothetical protein [Lachnospiraceae bacterium]